MEKYKKIIEQPRLDECRQPSPLGLLLADAIFIFHCIIVIFVLFAPFTNLPAILILHSTFALCLMVHWYANSNICSLSLMELHLRGLDNREDTFTHQFIAPMYDISSTEWSQIVWIITFIVMCISIYKLYNTEKFKLAWECYSRMTTPKTFGEKMEQFVFCFKPLFIL